MIGSQTPKNIIYRKSALDSTFDLSTSETPLLSIPISKTPDAKNTSTSYK